MRQFPVEYPAELKSPIHKRVYKMNKLAYLFLISMTLFIPAASAGNVTGKINFTGTAPALQPIDMGADPTCASSGEKLNSEDVVANPNGTLANVFVYVKEGLEGKTFPAPSTPVLMDQKGCHYIPHVQGLQVGQTLQIVNSDSTLHNVHGMPKETKEFNLGMPIQGMKLDRKFDKPEVMVKFKCDVHPWMHAYLGILPHPFFAVSGTEGRYEIKDLPAGSYTLEAWHEKYGVQSVKVTVEEAGAQNADLTFAG